MLNHEEHEVFFFMPFMLFMVDFSLVVKFFIFVANP